jgi:tetratricopeptide (TPR) repeat protein/transglutaminase-like putative cysteine protease
VLSLVFAAKERLFRRGDPVRAGELVREALKKDRYLGEAHALLAHLALLRADVKAAFRHQLEALADARNRDTALLLDQIPLPYLNRSELRQLAALMENLSNNHPSPDSRAEALSFLVRIQLHLGDTTSAQKTLERRTRVAAWHGIGGFDNEDGKGYDTPYPPEREVNLDKTYTGSRGKVRWRRVNQKGPSPALELDELFYPFSYNVAYLLTFVESSKERDILMEVTTSGPIKAWINDRRVLANRQVRSIRQRQFKIPVRLRAGFNKILIKSCVEKGSWHVGLWLTTRDHSPLSLKVDPGARPYKTNPGAPEPWADRLVLPSHLKKNKDNPRRDLWAGLTLASSGLRPAAIAALERHLQLHPKDPVALYHTARLHAAEDHLQQASRLLERGQKLPPPYSSRFWIAAASLYRKRGQYDKAFNALRRATAASPRGELMIARGLDHLYRLKRWTLDRFRLARRLQEKNPEWLWPTMVLARCSRTLRRYDEQIRWLRRGVTLSPANEAVRDRLVNALMRRGRCMSATTLQKATTGLRPFRAYPFLRLARIHRACGKLDSTLEALDRCTERIPNWPTPYELRGKILYELGRTDEAIAQWEIALKHNPNHVKLWDRVSHLRPDRDPVLQEFTPTETQIKALRRAGRAIEAAEGSSVIWLLDHEVSRLMPDGTFKRVVTTIRKVVDETGRDRLGQARLPGSGLVKVLEAYTVNRAGRRREVTSLHGRKVRYPTLEVGAVVVLQYRHIQRPAGYLRHHLATNWRFQHNLEQAERAEWVLAIPPERKLNLHLQGDIKHRVTRRHGLAVHTFSSLRVPPLRPEPRSLPSRDLLRTVTVSTVPSWDYFSEWGNSLTNEVFAMDPALKKTLRRLVGGKRTMAGRIKAIYHFALRRIRYQQDYETFIAGVKPHTAAAVLTRGYGDCKDKSVLMIAMLRQLGIKANLALIRTRRAGRVIADVPSQQFNHAVVYLPPQPGLKQGRFLDATAENLDIDVLRPDVQGTLSLVLFEGGYRLIPVPYQGPDQNWFNIQVSLDLKADGSAGATIDLIGSGVLAGRVRKPFQNKQILRQYAQSIVHNLYPGCSLEQARVKGHQTILEPLTVRLTAQCTDVARTEEGLQRLRPAQLVGMSTRAATWTERRHPIYFGPPALERADLTVRLPKGASKRTLPKPLRHQSPCAEVAAEWITLPNGDLRYRQRVVRSCAVLKPAGYPAFRTTMTKLKKYLESEVVIAPPIAAPQEAKKAKKAKKAKAKKAKKAKAKAKK